MNERDRRELRRAWRAALANGLRIVLIGRIGQSYIAFARDRAGHVSTAIGHSLPAAVGQLIS